MMTIMNNIADLWVKKFEANGSCILNEINAFNVSANVIKRSINKNSNVKIIIIVDKYETRSKLINVLSNNQISSQNYTCISEQFINENINYSYNIAIYIGLLSMDKAIHVINKTRFNLFIITNNKLNAQNRFDLYNRLPIMNNANNNVDNCCLPVEEHRIAVKFNDDKIKDKYNDYSDFINSCITIFGSFEDIERARIGDKKTGQSAENVRQTIAAYNGWRTDLDTSIPFNAEIDKHFNPIVLEEKANTAYNIMRERRNIVTDNNAKLPIILDLVNNQLKNKKVIIVSKRGEFASIITEYLLENNIPCGDFHDKAEPRAIIDENTGDYIRYKTGNRKGEIKLFCTQAISTINLQRFNEYDTKSGDYSDENPNGLLRVLSIKNRSSDSLETSVDAIIFTSPFNDSINEFRYRFNAIKYNNNKCEVYKLYMDETIEEKELSKEKESETHKIINDKDKCDFYVN